VLLRYHHLLLQVEFLFWTALLYIATLYLESLMLVSAASDCLLYNITLSVGCNLTCSAASDLVGYDFQEAGILFTGSALAAFYLSGVHAELCNHAAFTASHQCFFSFR
jgi:hypothetical protein